MGQVIKFNTSRPVRGQLPRGMYRCTRCGADLWNLFADGRVCCADCEQECPLRIVAPEECGDANDEE